MPNFFDLMNRLKAFVYYDDHGEPHYHICRGRESLAKVRMRDFSVIDGWVESRVVRELRGLHERIPGRSAQSAWQGSAWRTCSRQSDKSRPIELKHARNGEIGGVTMAVPHVPILRHELELDAGGCGHLRKRVEPGIPVP